VSAIFYYWLNDKSVQLNSVLFVVVVYAGCDVRDTVVVRPPAFDIDQRVAAKQIEIVSLQCGLSHGTATISMTYNNR